MICGMGSIYNVIPTIPTYPMLHMPQRAMPMYHECPGLRYRLQYWADALEYIYTTTSQMKA